MQQTYLDSVDLTCVCFREHSCSISYRVHPQCQITLCWTPSEECHPSSMRCFWCSPTSEQVELGSDHVPFYQRLHSSGTLKTCYIPSTPSEYRIYHCFWLFEKDVTAANIWDSKHQHIDKILHLNIGGWNRGWCKGATGYILSLLWCCIYNAAPHKICSDAS